MNKKLLLRDFVITALDDQDGINEAAYVKLQALEAAIDNGSCGDIFNLVQATDGRYYLPEDHGLVAWLGLTN